MTISAFVHPILSALLGDQEVSRAFSVEADIRAMLVFEKALASAQAAVGVISEKAAARIGQVCADFSPEIATLAEGVAQDGVVAPTLVRLLRQKVGEPFAANVHFGATSQDVIDTSLILRLKPLVASLGARLDALIGALRAIEVEQGATPLIGRTRMQRALPIHAVDKLRGWREPLQRHGDRLVELKQRLLVVQFGGAVGTRGGLDGYGDAIAAEVARLLELKTDRVGKSSATVLPNLPVGCRWFLARSARSSKTLRLWRRTRSRKSSWLEAAPRRRWRTNQIRWARRPSSLWLASTLRSFLPSTIRSFMRTSGQAPPGRWSGWSCRRCLLQLARRCGTRLRFVRGFASLRPQFEVQEAPQKKL